MVLVRSLRLNQRELDTLGLPADCFGVGGGVDTPYTLDEPKKFRAENVLVKSFHSFFRCTVT